MEMSKNPGSSVDPPRLTRSLYFPTRTIEAMWRFVSGENLSVELLWKILLQHGKDLSQQELEDLWDKVKRLKGKSDLTEEGNSPGCSTKRSDWANPDSIFANYYRNELETKVGDDFNELAYKVINMIPDADWMEFARTALKVDGQTERNIRTYGIPSRNMKYDMIMHWQTSQKDAGQDSSGKALLDLAIKFLAQKGRDTRIVQQNFGTIHAQTFNAFCPSNHGAPMQAPA